MTPPAALDTATGLLEAARELARSPWERVDGPEAVEIARVVATARGLLDAVLLRTVDRIETTHVLDQLGWASTKDFLTHLTGGHKGTGGGLVRAVAQLRELPAVQTALEDGRVTLPQARVIAARVATLPRVAEFRTAVAERMLEEVATRGLDASDLGTAFGDVVRELDPDSKLVNAEKEKTKAERSAHHARHLSLTEDGLGGVRLKGYGTIEDAERIKTVLMPLAAPLTTQPGACGGVNQAPDQPVFDEHGVSTQVPCLTPGCGHDGRDPRDAGARMWDALIDACDRLRATETLPRDHGSVPKVIVLIDQESLQQRVIDAGLAQPAATPTGARLSAHATRRLACDAEIVPAVLGTHSQVLDVGRTQRLVTPALWTALIVRDRHCAFPGCTRVPLACDAHHIVHWADGGTTSLDNLVMLCRYHHVLTHQTPWAVQIDPVTGHPVWTPPPRATLDHRRFTYHRPRPARQHRPARPPRPPGTSPPQAA
ncbi:HNH endonuclease signature motif containing protein [Nocardioides humi]|uniref:HNH endonuclease signature motif containing protein n=1 Tax=Nocardioides humi TaxID=449461 RepID=A0ABN2BF58_9ACTN|nr:HNH endonuclease signature motif containing protein [Nocardioides humi]